MPHLQYNREQINYTVQIPQCFVYFQLLGLVKPKYLKRIGTDPPRIETLESAFFTFDEKFIITGIKDKLTYTNDQKYVMALIIQYFITYTDPIKIKVQEGHQTTLANIYKGSQEEEKKTDTETDPYQKFEQSFQGQLLRYRLEQLKSQMNLEDKDQNIEPIIVSSYQLDDNGKFDIFDNSNGSIRTKEPGLEGLFQSIDDIIGMV